ncbi:MAG: peptidase, partial [Alphaproteobacteria bacterium]
MTGTAPDTAAALPRLRAELRLHDGPQGRAGAASWVIEDPVRNTFFQIDNRAFAILSLWDAGTTEAILSAAKECGIHAVSIEEVAELRDFLVRNGLTAIEPLADYGALTARVKAREKTWLQTAIHNYLFFRIPLLRPHKFLQNTLPLFDLVFNRISWSIFGFIAIIGTYIATRQWDAFVSTFLQFTNLNGLIFYFLCLGIVKTAHEFAHAYVATRYGVRVGTIGIAFLVLFPLPYADVTGAWKLRSRKQRLLISAAGMIAEMMIAALAVFVWAFAPEGQVKSAAFFMATVSLATSLFVNLNPFMRFDGYYILSDALGVPNLQNRAFALGSWWMRNLLFGLNAPNPDDLSRNLTSFCVVYAYLIWLYRLIVFTGIALLVYSFFIKVVGIVLFLIEIIVFIIRPIFGELREWWAMRHLIVKQRRTFVTALALILGGATLCLPISRTVSVPAILRAETEMRVFAPRPAEIVAILAREGMPVTEGQPLFELRSPQLEQEIALTRQRIDALSIRLARRAADKTDRSEGPVLEHQFAAEKSKLEGLKHEMTLLQVRSPVTGMVADVQQTLHSGRFVNMKTPLAIIRGVDASIVEGYVREESLWRLKAGARGEFIPEDASLKRVPVRLTEIAYAASDTLDIPYLSSIYDGAIAAKQTSHEQMHPVSAVHRL